MGRVDKFLTNFFKSLFSSSEKKVEKIPVKRTKKYVTIICNDCGWEGSVADSLKRDISNDSCPICGNKVLSYDITSLGND